MNEREAYKQRMQLFKEKAKEIHPVRFTYKQVELLEAIFYNTPASDYYEEEVAEIESLIINAEAKEEVDNERP